MPGIVKDLEGHVGDVTGERAERGGRPRPGLVQHHTDDPEKLIGPITSIGLNVAGVIGALILILITAYYMAVRPDPLVDGLVSLRRPPARACPPRPRAAPGVLDRLDGGRGVDMFVTGVLSYIGLTIVGLDFAIFFAVLSALLVVVPYFGAIAGAIPPVLFALTDSPGKALLVLITYVVVQQLESNVTIPVVMSQRVRMHPAMIAIGVLVVGQLFGFVGLFVAVPILSLIAICVRSSGSSRSTSRSERDAPGDRAAAHAASPGARGSGGAGQTSFVIAIRAPISHEHDDQDLDDDPEAGQLAHSR